jgi:hypothetical protein
MERESSAKPGDVACTQVIHGIAQPCCESEASRDPTTKCAVRA